MRKADSKFISIIKIFFEKYFVYVFSFCVVAINFTLMFDNVVWGDEAYSGEIIRNTNLYGIYQRVFYFENHPPLYYYYLRLFADVIGYKTWVYHLASLLPFTATVLFSLIVWKKKLGTFPVLFYVAISGLSACCVEYNLEIRMYELCFLFIFLCVYFCYKLLESTDKRYFIGIVICGVLSAYSHYYGLVSTGIVLFLTSVVYAIKNKKKSWLCGFFAIIAYLVLYGPWFVVLFRQMGYVANKWWITEPDSLKVLIKFLFTNGRLTKVLLLLTCVCGLIVVVADLQMLTIEKKDKNKFLCVFSKPKFTPSIKLQGMFICWGAIMLTVGLMYVMSKLFRPILIDRYMHPLIPFMLTSLMLSISRLFEIAKKWNILKGIGITVGIVFAVMTLLGLLDFKYYRSVTRVEEVKTQEILGIIGDIDDDTVLTSQHVNHLTWTVLYYYYPDGNIQDLYPNQVQEDAGNIWSFYDGYFPEEVMNEMAQKGYEFDVFEDKQIGKYHCYLYHFYK